MILDLVTLGGFDEIERGKKFTICCSFNNFHQLIKVFCSTVLVVLSGVAADERPKGRQQLVLLCRRVAAVPS